MTWVKNGSNKWTLYLNGDVAGYIVKTKYNNGKIVYSGIAMYKEKRAVSKAVTGSTLTPVKNAILRLAKAQRK